jgi:hypothetical protein
MISKILRLSILGFVFLLSSCAKESVDFIDDDMVSNPTPRPPVNLEVRNEGRRLVEACAAQMRVDRLRVREEISHVGGRRLDARYSIRRGTSAETPIVLEIKIYAFYEDPAVLKRLEALLPGIRGFFERYGLGIDLIFEFSDFKHRNFGRACLNDQAVHLTIKDCITDTEEWCFFPGKDKTFWATIVHEIGHYFGLEDEYWDKHYPNRFVAPETDPVSIMQQGDTPDRLDFYPRHIKAILAPVCPHLE